jgi:hypothetical protein
MKQVGIAALTLAAVFAVTPATAKMMSCTSENMAKSITTVDSMPDGPQKLAMMREMGMANTAMSKGDTRGACKSYMRVQQMETMKSYGGMRGM